MKNLLFSILFLLIHSIANGKEYNRIIIPLSADKLNDELIRQDVYSILDGKVGDNLFEYKTKGKDNWVNTTFKRDNWRFYLEFPEKIIAQKFKKIFEVYCQPEGVFFNYLRYYHVKFMLHFTAYSLSAVNKEIISEFGGQSVSCVVNSYITKDRLKNYLYLSIERDNKKLDFVFIIQNSAFYECVINRTN